MIIQGDAFNLPLSDNSVHCIVTSPPYWNARDYGLAPRPIGGDRNCDHQWGSYRYARRSSDASPESTSANMGNKGSLGRDVPVENALCERCGAWLGQFGLEPWVDLYVEHLVLAMRECWRVLRDDGILFLNIGDSYISSSDGRYRAIGFERPGNGTPTLKPKDRAGIPERSVLALQADGWYWRSTIIWHKPNPMPESVKDRPTNAFEYVYMLTKSPRYFYDWLAGAEPIEKKTLERYYRGWGGIDSPKCKGQGRADYAWAAGPHDRPLPLLRNVRNVWTLGTANYHGAHFAVMPEELARRCIVLGTSERGVCPQCGAPWERIAEREAADANCVPNGKSAERDWRWKQEPPRDAEFVIHRTVGWRPTCRCGAEDVVPAIVLDPFAGSGTTVAVAEAMGRRGIGIEVSPDYVGLACERTRERRLL